jgi:hypothetical protein
VHCCICAHCLPVTADTTRLSPAHSRHSRVQHLQRLDPVCCSLIGYPLAGLRGCYPLCQTMLRVVLRMQLHLLCCLGDWKC